MDGTVHRSSVISVVLFCLVLVAGVATGAERFSPRPPNPLFPESIEDANRVILVLHRGRPGPEIASGSRMNMYRSRGYNRDATWNRRVARAIAERHGLSYLTDWWMSEIEVNCAVLRIQEGDSVDEVIARLREDPEVVTAHRLTVFSTLTSQPDDPYFELQAAARYFDLPTLHAHSTGQDIRIAVVDTGIETRHHDLDGQVTRRKNFVREVSPGYSTDMHGTAVAGVIAAHANNGAGIAGMAPGARLLGLKACWPLVEGELEAICNSFTLALAINQAMVYGVDIINLSLTGPPDDIVRMLIDEALDSGIVVIAATRRNDTSASRSFPASIPGVIAVTGTGFDSPRVAGQPVYAPSQNILTTLPGDSYNFVSGTSLGAAHVTGYVALLLQQNPELRATEIHHRLIEYNNWNIGQYSDSPGAEEPGVLPPVR